MEDQTTTKTEAAFYRALGLAGADGMPMPFQVYFSAAGWVELRYRTAEQVEAAATHSGGRADHDSTTFKPRKRDLLKHTWHSYGTKYGDGQPGRLAGWSVHIWASVDGPGAES